jgi:tetratricopeptide (TPR) repeat protein
VSQIHDTAPGAAEALSLGGRALLLGGRVAPGRSLLERSLAMKPDQPAALELLAAIELAGGDSRRGLALLERASRLDPADYHPWFAMGKVYHDLNRFEESARAYAEALERHPPPVDEGEIRRSQIRALLNDGRHDEASQAITQALAADPRNAAALGLAAWNASDLGHDPEALDFAQRCLEADPKNFDALLVRSRLTLMDHPAEARADLLEALAIHPNHLGALQRLMQVESRLGHDAEASAARERFRQATDRLALMDKLTKEISARPDDPEPRWKMGRAALDGGLPTLARQSFQAALDINPRYRPALRDLASMNAPPKLDQRSGVPAAGPNR